MRETEQGCYFESCSDANQFCEEQIESDYKEVAREWATMIRRPPSPYWCTITDRQAIDSMFGTRNIDLEKKYRQTLEAIESSIQDIITRSPMFLTKEATFDVVGDSLDVGRVVEGVPENCFAWTSDKREVTGNCHIAISVCHNCYTTEAVIIQRGCALLALVDLLEGIGIRCSISACLFITHDKWSSNAKNHHVIYNIKHHSQPIDTDLCMFWLTSAGVLRKLAAASFGRMPKVRGPGDEGATSIDKAMIQDTYNTDPIDLVINTGDFADANADSIIRTFEQIYAAKTKGD